MKKQIVIIGGGFGGVRCALDLARKKILETEITLINNHPYLEYTPSAYRLVTGSPKDAICIPLAEIFENKKINIVQDKVDNINLNDKFVKCASGSQYKFDFLVLAVGSETTYFNIPGLKELSFGFKTINEAMRLKGHLEQIFSDYQKSSGQTKGTCINIVIVGGGASGVELTGQLAVYARQLSQKNNIDRSLVSIDLIEGSSRLLPNLPEDISEKVRQRLYSLGVNIFLNRLLIQEDINKAYMKDMEMKTKTLIWTAGVAASHTYSTVPAFNLGKGGKIKVDKFLQADGWNGVFIIGDSAITAYSGLAQTAIRDGAFVANAIVRKIYGKKIQDYRPVRPIYAIPVGPSWAAVLIGRYRFYGIFGWCLRRLADLHFFISVLPLKKALGMLLK